MGVGTYLVENVGTGFTNVASHLLQDSDVVVRVQQRVLLGTVGSSGRHLVGLETRLGEDNDETLGVMVVGGDGSCLLSNESGERRERLGSRPLSERRSSHLCGGVGRNFGGVKG
jgi:hypothetical protein